MATFFLVEDNRLLNEFCRLTLEEHGHKVLGQAFDGHECIEKICSLKESTGKYPDYIIMDYTMPIKNGVDATKELLKLDPDLNIIFISGDSTIKEEAISAGAGAFFEKPLNVVTLLAELQKI
jgi:two-component system chemotaxis response regulator CheY